MLKYSANLWKSFISLFASFKLWTGKSFDQWFPTPRHVCCLVNDAIQLSWSILKQEVMVYTNISRAILKNIYNPHTMLRRPLMSPTLSPHSAGATIHLSQPNSLDCDHPPLPPSIHNTQHITRSGDWSIIHPRGLMSESGDILQHFTEMSTINFHSPDILLNSFSAVE